MANIILTNISVLPKNKIEENIYKSDLGDIKGVYTNDAPVKYLIESVFNGKREETIIIAITTKEAEPAYGVFEETIRRYCEEKGYKGVKIEKVPFADRMFGRVIADIIEKIAPNSRVFVDATGGYRDIAYVILAVVRILEYSKIKLIKSVYSQWNILEIKDIGNVYSMFNLINAANSFASFGNSDEFASFFEDNDNPDIKRVITVMNRFSDEIALCRTAKLGETLQELNANLSKIQELGTVNENELMFKSLTGMIRNKFGFEMDRTIEYTDVIKWCLDNRMIQQAVTLYVEKMPEFIFKKRLISYEKNYLEKQKSNFNKNFDDYYNMLYNFFLKLFSDITYSPYPVGNLLLKLNKKDPFKYKELCQIRDLSKFSLFNQLSDDEKRGIDNLIRIKNAMFDENGKQRVYDEIKENAQNPKLSRFSRLIDQYKDAGCTKPEAWVNKIKNDEKQNNWFKLLQEEFTPHEPKVWNEVDLNVIEHLDDTLKDNGDKFTLNRKISCDEMSYAIRNLMFVKRYVRNSLNHASEENNLPEGYNDYFRSKGYNVDSELLVYEIKNIINDGVEKFKDMAAKVDT